MDWKLELVVVPVTDVDRSKAFYSQQLGFNVDVRDQHRRRQQRASARPGNASGRVAIASDRMDVARNDRRRARAAGAIYRRPRADGRRAFGEQRDGDWRLLPTSANRQPAAASYLQRAGDTVCRPFKLDVLRASGGRVVEITTFGSSLFPQFGLPAVL